MITKYLAIVRIAMTLAMVCVIVASISAAASAPSASVASAANNRGANYGAVDFVVSLRSISISPDYGPVGTSATVTGTFFPALASVNVTIGGLFFASSSTGVNGSFSAVGTIPSLPAGEKVVTATSGAASETTTFTVQPKIIISPEQGPVGTRATVTGTGFTASALITITIDGLPLASPFTNSVGSFSVIGTIPSLTTGVKTVEAHGGVENVAYTTFTVTPAITISPQQGPVEISATVNGTGFLASNSVTVTIAGSFFASQYTGPTGSFSATGTIPSLTAGAKTVTATDGVGNSATTTFNVTETETVSAPSTPTGPDIGEVGQSLTYSTGGGSSSLGHTLQYRFDWGDGSFSDWSSSNSASHSWSSANTYTIKAQARCATHTSVVSGWSAGKSLTPSPTPTPTVTTEETVSTPSTPAGPDSGKVGESLSYSTSATSSSLGHTLQYRFDWGDGSFSDWSSSNSASHSWSSANTYTIKAQARCATHTSVVSGWSVGKSLTPSPTPTPTPLPAISISPTEGPVGTNVTVTGISFGASTSVSINIAGSSLGSTTTNPSGGFSKSATIPSLSTGSKTVTATDGSRTATTTFNVTETVPPTPLPAISISPATGPVGTSVTVTGISFGASVSVSITIYGFKALTLDVVPESSSLSSATTNSSGSFSKSATIPALSTGNKTVSATDGSRTATCTFEVTGTVTSTVTPTPTVTSIPTKLKGDCDKDGDVDQVDVLIALKMAVGKVKLDLVADMNDDGQVTSLDAAEIMSIALK